MVVTDMLSNVLGWTNRQLHYYKTKEQMHTAYNALLQAMYAAEQKRQAEEIKALRLESELQLQRERLGRDLHDGFGSQLTHIISRLDLLAYTGVRDTSVLQRLSEFARDMNHTLRETIWLLDQETITVEAFGNRLHSLLLKVWEDRESPVLRWQFLNSPENPVLPLLLAQHLVRITQEATNNALKYAAASEIQVILEILETNLVLTILDNGYGFDLATVNQGFGLTNMRKRAEEVKGAFIVASDSLGTCINLILPLTF